MFGIDLSKIKIDLGKVERVFVDAVIEQAEMKNVNPNTIAVRIHPHKLEHVDDYGVMVTVSSLTGDFDDELVRLSSLTIYDQGNYISQAFMKVFEGEVKDHNSYLANNVATPTTKSYPHQIGYDGLELFVQAKPDPKHKSGWKADMNMIYKLKKLRSYDIKIEFADAQKHMTGTIDVPESVEGLPHTN